MPTVTIYAGGNHAAYKKDDNYGVAHAATVGQGDTSGIGQFYWAPGDPDYSIQREANSLDATSLPAGATITAVTFNFQLANFYAYTAFDMVIQQMPSDVDVFALTRYNKDNFSGNGGSLNTAGISGLVTIPLNATSISWISLSEVTKLGVRSSRDIAQVTPTGLEYITYSGVPYYRVTYTEAGVTTQAASSIGIDHAKGNGTATGEDITERGFEVKLVFSGTLREAINRSMAGFEGDFTYNISTGKWEGTLIKTVSEEGTFVAESFVGDLGRFPIAVASDKLFAAETYLYRARATIGGIVYYGEWVEFTTAGYPSGTGPDDIISPGIPIVDLIPPWVWPPFDMPPFEFDPSITFGKTFGAFLRGLDTKKDWITLREKCIIYQENMNEFVLVTNHNNLVIKNLVIDIISYIDGDVYPSDLGLVNSSQQLTPLYLEEISPSGFKDIINDFRLKDVCNVHILNLNFKKILNSLNSLYESDYVTEPISYNTIEYIDIQPTAKRMILQLEDMRKKYREVRRLTIRNMKRIFTYV